MVANEGRCPEQFKHHHPRRTGAAVTLAARGDVPEVAKESGGGVGRCSRLAPATMWQVRG